MDWTDDPVRDAENYYNAGHPYRPECECCEKVITSQFAYHIGTDWYCEECIEDMREEIESD